MGTQGLRLKISQSPVNEALRCVNCPFIKKKKYLSHLLLLSQVLKNGGPSGEKKADTFDFLLLCFGTLKS